jgi:hypothetical protein
MRRQLAGRRVRLACGRCVTRSSFRAVSAYLTTDWLCHPDRFPFSALWPPKETEMGKSQPKGLSLGSLLYGDGGFAAVVTRFRPN